MLPGPIFDPFQLAQLFGQRGAVRPEQVQRGLHLAMGLQKVPTGVTPKEVVWAKHKAILYHYLPQVEKRHRTPLLLIYALVNKSYILDLHPGNSFIEHMVRQGFEVYMLDWGEWGPEDREVSFATLALDYMPRAVRKVLRHSGQDSITMMGYCIGGILTALYGSLHPDGPLRNVIFMATPIDFATPGQFGLWLGRDTFPLEKVVATYGYMPGDFIGLGFQMMRPVTGFVTPYVTLADRAHDDRFVQGWAAMNQWVADRVNFPGAAFRQMVKELYQENRLVKGEFALDGQRVHLEEIRWPALLIAAELDHITPLATTLPLLERISSPQKDKLLVPAGHIGLVAGRGAVKSLWPKASDWLAAHSD